MSARRLGAALLLAAAAAARAAPDGKDVFRIEVVDDATGSGVPLVELVTVSQTRFVTDSAGVVAFDEPGLMDHDVFFTVRSHGYEFPADGFGIRGAKLHTARGASATLRIHRVNVAERLYRITGEGIYRDTVLTGGRPPLAEPLVAAQVCGQDSAHAIPWRGRIFWLWGDTNRASYPLGNFATTAATSLPPGAGGLDPAVGIDLTYFTREDGFTKSVCDVPGEGLKWMGALVTVEDEHGAERLLASYVRMKSLDVCLERGVALWDDEKQAFGKLREFPEDGPVFPSGHAFRAVDGGVERWYFGEPFPLLRVEATLEKLADPHAYEAFTCLKPGTKYDEKGVNVDRDASGALVRAWKPFTAPLDASQESHLVKTGRLASDEAMLALRDARTGEVVQAHGGSTYWNPWRKRWIALVGQAWGKPSFLGEIWYAEAETPLGPWTFAVRVVTHDRMSFYNPTQDAFLDADGGRLVHFEGTYTTSFSGVETPTPRYDYNQVMYRLALDDPRLTLPQPVRQDGRIAFLACDRAGEGLVPVPSSGAPAFFALPPASDIPGTVPLFGAPGAWTLAAPSADAKPLARVWANPSARVVLPQAPSPLPLAR